MSRKLEHVDATPNRTKYPPVCCQHYLVYNDDEKRGDSIKYGRIQSLEQWHRIPWSRRHDARLIVVFFQKWNEIMNLIRRKTFPSVQSSKVTDERKQSARGPCLTAAQEVWMKLSFANVRWFPYKLGPVITIRLKFYARFVQNVKKIFLYLRIRKCPMQETQMRRGKLSQFCLKSI